MPNVKDRARMMLDKLSDDATWEDIMYEFYVMMKIEKGLDDVETGKTLSHENIERRLYSNDDSVD